MATIGVLTKVMAVTKCSLCGGLGWYTVADRDRVVRKTCFFCVGKGER